MVAFDFLRSLLTRWTRDRVDFELEKVENRQNIHQNVHEKWESPWNVGLQLKDLIVIIQKLEEIKFIHFFWGGIGVLETKVAKQTLCLSFYCNLIGYYKQSLKSDWLFCVKCNLFISVILFRVSDGLLSV